MKQEPIKLTDFIGQDILFVLPRYHATKLWKVKLAGVDPGGIWIESQELLQGILAALNVPSAPRTPITFFPFSEISYVMAFTDNVALNEKSLGL